MLAASPCVVKLAGSWFVDSLLVLWQYSEPMKKKKITRYTPVTPQKKFWTGTFAKNYVTRNALNGKALDVVYKKELGVTYTEINKDFLVGVKKDARILEVGANVGVQLALLQKQGFTELYGIELNPDVATRARRHVPSVNIIAGDALDIPFKDGYFDYVFTAGVLIHISPKNIRRALSEICRVSNRYIWGFEYFAKTYTEIPYRGHRNVLWKANFPALYKKVCPNLKLIKRRLYQHRDDPTKNDVTFLFKKIPAKPK